MGTVVWSAGVLTQGQPWTELRHDTGGSRKGIGGGQLPQHLKGKLAENVYEMQAFCPRSCWALVREREQPWAIRE